MKRDINSNGYIFMYATVLVVIVAVLLTIAALWLQPYQQRNRENEKRINILLAAGLKDVNNENAAQLYEQRCTASLMLDENGNDSPNGTLPLYIIDNQVYVIPMQGKGLWGPISGYIAIGPDRVTVIGANFDHKSETPGLGGEITTEKFQSQFAGQRIMIDGNFAPIEFDAITGATKTSVGVENMIDNTLKMYLPYFEKPQP
jgi:Na+-transporting NADH:ubiquinone oxidoreductase subunit C